MQGTRVEIRSALRDERAAERRSRYAWLTMFSLLGCGSHTVSTPGMTHGQPSVAPGGAAAAQTTAGVAVQPAGSAAPPIAGAPGVGNSLAGSGGTAISAAGASAAGSGGVGMTAEAGGAADGGVMEPATYPMLDATQIGKPVDLKLSVMPALSLSEGPIWDVCAHKLLFVDVNASKIYSVGSDDQVSVFAMNTSNANGIAFDIDGSLILAQMGGKPGHIARLDKSGKITVLEPPGGPTLHTPDDVIVRSDGTIYFTDGNFPPIGTVDFGQLPIYALAPHGSNLVNGGSVVGPNGIELSPDEKTLYVDAYGEGRVVKFSVAADGTLTKGSALASGLTNPDSLCLDAAGNLYVGVSTGLQVLRPDGSKVALIPIASSQGTTNCTLGGEDGRTLYITAWTKVYKVEGMPIPGLDWVANRKRLGCM
jgi:gluconolactonase